MRCQHAAEMGRLPSRRDNHAKTVLLRPRGKISRRGGSAVRAHHMRFHLYAEITQLFDCPADNGRSLSLPIITATFFITFSALLLQSQKIK